MGGEERVKNWKTGEEKDLFFRIVFTQDDLAAGVALRIFTQGKFTVSVYLEKSRNRML